jgi:hypothetical protein
VSAGCQEVVLSISVILRFNELFIILMKSAARAKNNKTPDRGFVLQTFVSTNHFLDDLKRFATLFDN